jgi:hypothetical protein
MTVYQIFEMMAACSLGYEDFRDVIDQQPEPVQFSFWYQAWLAYNQASHDPHKWGDAPQSIENAIYELPIMHQRFTYDEALKHQQTYVDMFIAVYTAKWGVAPIEALVEQESLNFITVFL